MNTGCLFLCCSKSFDDYKLPGMVYSTIPAVAVFGTTAMGARFTSAFWDPSLFFWYTFSYTNYSVIILSAKANAACMPLMPTALASAFFFAISPWHINFSRQLFESNGALFFLSLATYVLLLSLRKIRFLPLAALLLGISVYFYYSVRLVIPFVVLAYLLINKKSS